MDLSEQGPRYIARAAEIQSKLEHDFQGLKWEVRFVPEINHALDDFVPFYSVKVEGNWKGKLLRGPLQNIPGSINEPAPVETVVDEIRRLLDTEIKTT